MNFAKRIMLFMAVNILIVATISIVLSLLGVGGAQYMRGGQLDIRSLAIFCMVWGFGGAFISLAISRIMAKWSMGVKVIDPNTSNPTERSLVDRVYRMSKDAGLTTMPQVGIYESPELNAFATGPTRNRSLVAVSSGLLHSMSESQVDGVLGHEIAHVANGDMVTMTLVQGVVNSFVMFLARIAAWAVGNMVEEKNRPMVQFGVTILLEIVLGVLGMIVVASYSRRREYRADIGGASLAGTSKMIAALQGLKQAYAVAESRGHGEIIDDGRAPALASMKISGKGGFLALFSTHPDLDDRIRRLEELQSRGGIGAFGRKALMG